jgi:wyosine [tRNA(Phe)-imidazoG37] synthetase (radical SAM superfamily)
MMIYVTYFFLSLNQDNFNFFICNNSKLGCHTTKHRKIINFSRISFSLKSLKKITFQKIGFGISKIIIKKIIGFGTA